MGWRIRIDDRCCISLIRIRDSYWNSYSVSCLVVVLVFCTVGGWFDGVGGGGVWPVARTVMLTVAILLLAPWLSVA